MITNTCPKCGCYIPDSWNKCPACEHTEKIEKPKEPASEVKKEENEN